MITVEISEDFQSKIGSDLIQKAALTALRNQSVSLRSEMTVIITTDDQIHRLNAKFLDIDAPTDVLSFPANYVDPENDSLYLGDILISYPRSKYQAQVRGHHVIEEIQLLVVHGVLHLLGYDHAAPDEKRKMWAVQKEILSQLGLESLFVPESE
jgi:probable rRNA maturation factor